MNLEINVKEASNQSNVILSGEIDAYTAPQLKETLLPLTKTEGQIVEVNLEHVNYMDSTGLGVFISALKSTKENGSQLKLVDLQTRVFRLFKITGLIDIMDIKAAIRGGSE
ncbi:anti-sigma factor antagonist [Virgibacillus dakarensis]|uniref:Anti-sigma factor antagonist n=1 Tax=Lentibacillus populi TaxID=1827502 RepID=A0A9W5U1K2_9BACI|nr:MULTISPECIES: STAS domain-containing protein [Bacillaceae]MBT2218571.1 STAS domain-containing protein [Virgibacillus dakarensis]MTW88294.1 anti-sigma factor antagonist [Virgibacillus dakarensis]GGB55483.1 anti-sigma-B factor antagonist [Lentibacillus populi]